MSLAALLLAATVSTVRANEVEIAGETVYLPPPDGFCLMDRSNAMDATIIDRVEHAQVGQSQILLHYADCDELEDWHAGKIITYMHYGNIASPYIDGRVRTIRGATRAEVLAKLKEAMPAFDEPALADALAAMDERISDVAIQRAQFLGLVGDDENAIYSAMVTTLESEGQQLTMAGVWGSTFLRSIVINVYRYQPMAPGAIEELLTELRPYLAELVRRNP